MSFVDPDQALGLLNDLGYRSAFRLDAWVECLVWVEEERWIGRGASRSEAVHDVLRHIFPSNASRRLLLNALGEDGGSFSSVESRVSRAHRPRESTGSAPIAAVERLPRATPEGPLELGSSVDDRDPEDVLADVGLLDELIDSKRPEMALMSPVRQRLSILSWICHARAAQGSGSHSRVVTAVTHIARKLTLLSKRWWPGSVLSLQLDATPFHVGRELDLPRTEWPRTWAEAARCAEERLRLVCQQGDEAGRDAYGWMDSDALVPAAAEPDRVLHDIRVQLEQVAGALDHKPPNRASEGIRRPIAEMRERQRYWTQLSRWIRRSTTDYVTWGAIMGRLRWMSTQASRRDDVLVQWLSTDFSPDETWFERTRIDEESEKKARLRTQVLRRATILKNVDLDAMLAWLFDAFAVLDSSAIVRQLAPYRRQILEINPSDLPEISDERRHRLVEVQSHLAQLTPDEMRPSLAGRSLPPSGLEVSYPQAADGDDSLERVRAMILPHTREKLCLFVGLAADDERLEQIREMFALNEVRFIAADSDNLSGVREAVTNADAAFLISATGFYSHLFDLEVIRECRRSDTLHVRAHDGDNATITMAFARQLGLKRTATAL